jgi:hypothetical protein
MSLQVPGYPPPRYTGDSGEISATLRLADAPPDYESFGVKYSYLGTKDSTGGDYLFVPPGGLHGFRNEADEPASILMLFAPGAPRERYFEDIAGLADMTDEERAEFFIGHDNFFA